MVVKKLKRKTASKYIIALFVALILLVGCAKETPATSPTPKPEDNELAISFSAATIPLNTVDSGVVTVRDAGNNILRKLALTKRLDYLNTDLTGLPAGTYNLDIRIITLVQADHSARQYALSKQFIFPASKIQLTAPNGKYNDQWLKRAILFSDQNEAIAVVAMYPGDPYYQVEFKEAKWNQTVLQRSVIDVNVMLAVKEHLKIVNGITGFEDTNAFIPYTNSVANKSWTKGTISLFLQHQSGREVYLNYDYNK
jgi:hypothetical protein